NSSMIAAKIVCWRFLFVPTLCLTTKAAHARRSRRNGAEGGGNHESDENRGGHFRADMGGGYRAGGGAVGQDFGRRGPHRRSVGFLRHLLGFLRQGFADRGADGG